MRFVTHTPAPPLGDFVESIWLFDAARADRGLERVLPSGTMQLLIGPPGEPFVAYEGDRATPLRWEGSIFCGARSEPVVIDPATPSSILGVHFRPGGAAPFLGCSAGDLRNTQVPLGEVWGRDGVTLVERLQSLAPPTARFRLLERVLRRRAARIREPHPAVRFALREFRRGPRTVGEVVSRLALSSRRFADLFRDEVGLTPKLYCRVRRFQRALRLIRSEARVDWACLALDCGYFDQAHLIRDFRLFSGASPTAYLAARGEFQNHVPLDA